MIEIICFEFWYSQLRPYKCNFMLHSDLIKFINLN